MESPESEYSSSAEKSQGVHISIQDDPNIITLFPVQGDAQESDPIEGQESGEHDLEDDLNDESPQPGDDSL